MQPSNPRRRTTLATLAALAATAAAPRAFAQEWPSKPIRVIVPYPPAGGTDVVFRILSDALAAELGQPIVVENKGGAAGNLGTDLAAKAAPDGYTILFTLSSHTINPLLYKLPFDVEKDFVPISMVASLPQILAANPAVPINNVQELIVAAMDSLVLGPLFAPIRRGDAARVPEEAPVMRELVEDWLRRSGGRLDAAELVDESSARWQYASNAAGCLAR